VTDDAWRGLLQLARRDDELHVEGQQHRQINKTAVAFNLTLDANTVAGGGSPECVCRIRSDQPRGRRSERAEAITLQAIDPDARRYADVCDHAEPGDGTLSGFNAATGRGELPPVMRWQRTHQIKATDRRARLRRSTAWMRGRITAERTGRGATAGAWTRQRAKRRRRRGTGSAGHIAFNATNSTVGGRTSPATTRWASPRRRCRPSGLDRGGRTTVRAEPIGATSGGGTIKVVAAGTNGCNAGEQLHRAGTRSSNTLTTRGELGGAGDHRRGRPPAATNETYATPSPLGNVGINTQFRRPSACWPRRGDNGRRRCVGSPRAEAVAHPERTYLVSTRIRGSRARATIGYNVSTIRVGIGEAAR